MKKSERIWKKCGCVRKKGKEGQGEKDNRNGECRGRWTSVCVGGGGQVSM